MAEHYQADMPFFETPAGGAVLSVSCISWGLGLNGNDLNNQVSRVMKNLVDRFVADEPHAVPARTRQRQLPDGRVGPRYQTFAS